MLLFIVLTGGGLAGLSDLIPTAVVVLLILGMLTWVLRDARQESKRLRQEYEERKPSADGDVSEVAGIPPRPPWMG
jgi:hypothetical protein